MHRREGCRQDGQVGYFCFKEQAEVEEREKDLVRTGVLLLISYVVLREDEEEQRDEDEE